MREIPFSAERLVNSLLDLPKERNVCLLDSSDVSHLGSRFLIAGFDPVATLEIREKDSDKTLRLLDEKLSQKNFAAILTVSYEFGLKLNSIQTRRKEISGLNEPDVFLALFDFLVIYDYAAKKTFLTGNENRFDEVERVLRDTENSNRTANSISRDISISSNFTRRNYLSAVENIQEYIRRGDTYQTNLTQQLRIHLPENTSPEQIFYNLRQNHPAAFGAFIQRKNDTIVSASPERFFRVRDREISVSPIKGTRRRGGNIAEDEQLKQELLNSEKDRAENVMIVDLLRNDIGRICEYGSVKVEKLCDLETHPTLFHLVSTVGGKLRRNLEFSDILKAAFPCGSITGAPKIRTMQIIDELETAPRGLSMGAIGFKVQSSKFPVQSSSFPFPTHHSQLTTHNYLDFSVAIRTMVIQNNEAVFNVGGGIVIDSVPELEYEESLLKAQALINAISGKQSNK